MTDLRYPIGPFEMESEITGERRRQYMEQLAGTPAKLREAVQGLPAAQLDTPYRPEGWTVRQVVHHVVDCHVNAYIRFKLTLTEDNPAVKPYNQKRWAELMDSRTAPVETSLAIFEGLYRRWVILLDSLSPEDFSRTMQHPDMGIFRLDSYLSMCVWHGNHHIAHIMGLRKRMNW